MIVTGALVLLILFRSTLFRWLRADLSRYFLDSDAGDAGRRSRMAVLMSVVFGSKVRRR
jgi:hypothetical protein